MRMYVTIILLLLLATTGLSQGRVQLTGITIDATSREAIQGVTIINKTGSTGAVTDSLGYFTLESRPGDSIEFVDIRYQNTAMVVPFGLDMNEDYGLIQLLERDEVLLDEITVFPFPSSQEFNRLFLDVEVPRGEEDQIFEVRRDVMALVRSQYENEKSFYAMWANRRLYELNGVIGPNNLINPINWTNFFYDLKKK